MAQKTEASNGSTEVEKTKLFSGLEGKDIYPQMRSEMDKRLDIRYQLFNYALGIFGIIMTLGIGDKGHYLALFIYPYICTGISLAWIDNHNRAKLVAYYLRENGAPWELRFKEHRKVQNIGPEREHIGALSTAAILVGTQLITFISGLYLNHPTSSDNIDLINFIIIFSGLSIGFTGILLFINYKDQELDKGTENNPSAV